MIHVRKKMKGNALVESFGALIVRLPQGAKDLRILGGLAWWVPYPGWFPITGRVKSYEKITEDIEDNKASEPSEPSEPSLLVRLRCVGPCARQVLVAWQCDMCRHFENCHNLPVFFFFCFTEILRRSWQFSLCCAWQQGVETGFWRLL